MKKHEKILTAVFGAGILSFLAAFLYKAISEGFLLDCTIFSGTFLIFGIVLIVSLAGLIPLLTNCRIRKRRELGKTPISKLYAASFALSLIPYILLVLDCTARAIFGYISFGTTYYGLEAVRDRLVLVWFYGFCCIVPILPLLAYWQLVFIVNLIRSIIIQRRQRS